MLQILHTNENSKLMLTSVANDVDINVVKQNIGGIIIDSSAIEDFNYLEAYEIIEENIVLNLEKAKILKVDFIRKQRDDAFLEFDKRYDIASKDGIDLTALKQERQRLKDAPTLASERLKFCSNLTEIKNLDFCSLL